jgi:hypothetical protein
MNSPNDHVTISIAVSGNALTNAPHVRRLFHAIIVIRVSINTGSAGENAPQNSRLPVVANFDLLAAYDRPHT